MNNYKGQAPLGKKINRGQRAIVSKKISRVRLDLIVF